jgi:tRNA(Ile)-lysidine synthetase-like protein
VNATDRRLRCRVRRSRVCVKARTALHERCAIGGGERVIVALSGGADSTALLMCAWAWAGGRNAVTLAGAVHVHHHLRGADADADADHCARLCATLCIPLQTVHVHPTKHGGGISASARRLRLAALETCAVEADASAVLLAHQADDVLETLLMRLGRGTAHRGLALIPWSRPASPKSTVRFARPLLGCTRVQLESLCRLCAVGWREDASNQSAQSARGWLRAKITPVLLQRWPRMAQHAVDAAGVARDGSWALAQIAAHAPWSGARVSRAVMREVGPARSAAILGFHPLLRDSGFTPRTLREVARAACDQQTRTRSFECGAVRLSVGARECVVGGATSGPA